MKKIRIYMLYLLQLFIIGIFVLVLLGDRMQIGRKNFFENEMFSENVCGLQMSSHQLNESVSFSIPVISDSDYMVYRYLSNSEKAAVRGVYGTSDVFDFSSLISDGRFFRADDYANGTMTAVVGTAILPETVEHDGKRFYLYDNAEYEVIGIFGEQGNIVDRAVFLNLTALDANISQTGGIYYVDAKERNTVDAVIAQMKSDIANRFTVTEIAFEPMTSRELGRYFTTLFVFCNISAILCLVITTIFLIAGQRYTIAVKKLCGMTKRDLFFYYGKIMALITIAAILLIVIAMQLLTAFVPISVFRESGINGWHYLMMGLVLMVIGLCNTYYITRLSSTVDISSVLKGI